MKKVYQSFISILLVFSLLASMTLTSFATAKNNKVGDKVTLYEDHETIVEMYTDLSGNRILNQYLNGKLIQRDTLLTSSPNSIKRDFFDDSVTRKSSSDVIYIEQYGKLTSDNNERVQPCAVQTAGTIKYRAALDTGYIYYGLKCTYDTKNLGSTTSLYSLILAVQSCPIVFRQLTAFLPCSFPVHLSTFGKAGGFPRCFAG